MEERVDSFLPIAKSMDRVIAVNPAAVSVSQDSHKLFVALIAAGQFKDAQNIPGSEALAIQALEHGDRRIRAQAARYLVNIGANKSAPQLMKWLENFGRPGSDRADNQAVREALVEFKDQGVAAMLLNKLKSFDRVHDSPSLIASWILLAGDIADPDLVDYIRTFEGEFPMWDFESHFGSDGGDDHDLANVIELQSKNKREWYLVQDAVRSVLKTRGRSEVRQKPDSMPVLADILNKKFQAGSMLAFVDLDTGLGNFIPVFKGFLKGKGYRIDRAMGTEPLPGIIDKAPAGVRDAILRANAQLPEEFLSLGKNTFDIVTVNHIETAPGELARRAKELLKPSGLLLVTVEETDVMEGIDARIIREVRGAGFDVQILKKPGDYPGYETQFRSNVLLVATPKSSRSEMRTLQTAPGARTPVSSEPDIGFGLKAVYDALHRGGDAATARQDILKLLKNFDLEFPRSEELRRLKEKLTTVMDMLKLNAPATAMNLLLEVSRAPDMAALPHLKGFADLPEPKWIQPRPSGIREFEWQGATADFKRSLAKRGARGDFKIVASEFPEQDRLVVEKAASALGLESEPGIAFYMNGDRRKARLWIAMELLKAMNKQEGRITNDRLRQLLEKVIASVQPQVGQIPGKSISGPQLHANLAGLSERDWSDLVRDFPVVLAMLVALRAHLSINVDAKREAVEGIQKKFDALIAQEGISLAPGQLRFVPALKGSPFESFKAGSKADALIARDVKAVNAYNKNVTTRWFAKDEGDMGSLAAGLATALLYAASDKKLDPLRFHTPSEYETVLAAVISAITGYASVLKAA
jgi:hypothetical protein